ncbi:MAG: hypothetical protein LWY06_04655 [Firmicutes bacterium]|nr:hypothetical protein [Bacillota bacterium]
MENSNMTNNYVAAFDFDGVVWDSVDECFHTGRRFFDSLRDLDPQIEEKIKKKFRQGRYLAKNGDDFFINFRLIEENPLIDFNKITFGQYYSFREIWKEEITDFAVKFYNERAKLQKDEPELWASWQRPMPGIMEQLPLVKERFKDVAVCSTKDKATIELLFEKYGQKYSVYGREHSKYKPDQINSLSLEKNTPPDKIIFIDDLIENLQQVQTTGAICVLTKWGYNNEAQWQKGKELGFHLIGPENIADQLEAIVKNG